VTSFQLWLLFLLGLVGLGLAGAYQTLRFGLVTTNLTDRVPWGLWITLDLSAIGLGAGAFTFSAIVYLFRLRRFEPVARMAVFVGFLGYTAAMLALVMDIGRPDRFWHPLVYWNVHSVLWEITWCVVLYSTVLVIELLPILFASPLFRRWPRLGALGHQLHRLTPILALLGLFLSLLHQSSLGATYGVLSGRAIWFRPTMPALFILSAVASGLCLTLLATMVATRLVGQPTLSQKLRQEIARIAGLAMVAYLYLKLWDWAVTSYYSHTPGTADALARLQMATPFSWTFWWIEVLLAGAVPAVLLLAPSFSRNERALTIALLLAPLGLIVNRWNVTLSGLIAPPQWSPGIRGNLLAAAYAPSPVELMVALGIVGYLLLGFTLGVRYLPLLGRAAIEPP
jgi:molybdopterin-containing oxidoreductase family membrane subunit